MTGLAALGAKLAASLLFHSGPSVAIISPEAIVQIICYGKHFDSAGTAFRVGPTGTLLSVSHVTSEPNCFIGGKPIGRVWKSPTSDFSMIDGDEGPYLPIDCGGFVKGRKYLSLGYARGLNTITAVELEATGVTDRNGEAVLEGMFAVVPGMSGGPVIDEETGRVVGTVNMEDFEDGLSWSVPLSATPLCKKPDNA